MNCTIHDDANHRRLSLSGRFTYEDAAAFSAILESWDFRVRPSAVIDAERLAMIDSVAIGMVFLLAERCKAHGGRLTVTKAHDGVAHTLQRSGLGDWLERPDGRPAAEART